MAANLRVGELFDVTGRWVAITGGGKTSNILLHPWQDAVPGRRLTRDLASGIGLMLARGCASNGANVILIDVNEKALHDVKPELEGLSESSSVSNKIEVATSVHIHLTYDHDRLLTASTEYMPISQVRRVSRLW